MTSKKTDAKLFVAVQVGAEAKEVRNLLKPKWPWVTAANANARYSLPTSSYDNATPLHIAVSHGNLPAVIELCDGGADVNAKTTLGWVPLHFVYSSDDAGIVEYLVTKGADVKATSDNLETALHRANVGGMDDEITDGRLATLKALIKAGVPVNAASKTEGTALHMAADRVRTKIVKLLLDSGADPKIRNIYRQTVFELVQSKELSKYKTPEQKKRCEDVLMMLSV